jgi:hypothetical protein
MVRAQKGFSFRFLCTLLIYSSSSSTHLGHLNSSDDNPDSDDSLGAHDQINANAPTPPTLQPTARRIEMAMGAVAAWARDSTRLEPQVCSFFPFFYMLTYLLFNTHLDHLNSNNDDHNDHTSSPPTLQPTTQHIRTTMAAAAGARDVTCFELLVRSFFCFIIIYYHANVYLG